jgi:signal recognition particle receptor subunit beta
MSGSVFAGDSAVLSLPRVSLLGPMGIGKTTALRSLCGEEMASSDVPNLDRASHSKEFTTVGAEFGEIDLGDGERVQICGCPGQERFDFVRHWMLSVSMGIFVMVDLSDPNAFIHASVLLDEVLALDRKPLALILSARPSTDSQVNHFSRQLREGGYGVIPILQADPRNKQQLLDALGVLVAMLSLNSEGAQA